MLVRAAQVAAQLMRGVQGRIEQALVVHTGGLRQGPALLVAGALGDVFGAAAPLDGLEDGFDGVLVVLDYVDLRLLSRTGGRAGVTPPCTAGSGLEC